MQKIFYKKNTVLRREHFGVLVLTLDGKRFLLGRKYFDLLQSISGQTIESLKESFSQKFSQDEVQNVVDMLVSKGILVKELSYPLHAVNIVENKVISEDTLSFPRTVYWESTQICNFRCLHCYSEGNTKGFPGLDLPIIKKLIDEMTTCGVEFFNIGGGEPLLYRHIFEVIDYCSTKGLGLELTSNGSLLTEQNILKLKQSGLKFIQISIDGANKKSFEAMRVGSNFDQVLANIRELKKHGFIISVNTVLTKINFQEIPDIIRLSESIGASYYKVSPLMETGRSCGNISKIRLTNQELRYAYEELDKYSQLNKTSSIKVIVNKNVLYPQVKNIEWMPECHYGCPAGRTTCGIDSMGNVYPCSYMNHKELICGNIQEGSLLEIWTKAGVLNEIRNIGSLEGKCGDCQHLKTCRGGCRAAAFLRTGKLSESDPLCVVDI